MRGRSMTLRIIIFALIFALLLLGIWWDTRVPAAMLLVSEGKLPSEGLPSGSTSRWTKDDRSRSSWFSVGFPSDASGDFALLAGGSIEASRSGRDADSTIVTITLGDGRVVSYSQRVDSYIVSYANSIIWCYVDYDSTLCYTKHGVGYYASLIALRFRERNPQRKKE